MRHVRGKGEVHTGFWWENTRKGNFKGSKRRWEDNIKMDLQEVGRGCGDWMGLAQDRDRWWAVVSPVMNFRVVP